MDTQTIVIAVLSGGGVAAIIQAWSQVKIATATARANTAAREAEVLAGQQAEFRKSLLDRVHALETDLSRINAQNDALIKENADLAAKFSTLSAKLDETKQRLTEAILERDILQKEVDRQHLQIERMKQEINILKRQSHG